MARRYAFADEPMSRLAIWARRMALFSLCAVIVSSIIVRSEWLDIGPALTSVLGGAGALRSRAGAHARARGPGGDLDGRDARARAGDGRHGDRDGLAGLSGLSGLPGLQAALA